LMARHKSQPVVPSFQRELTEKILYNIIGAAKCAAKMYSHFHSLLCWHLVLMTKFVKCFFLNHARRKNIVWFIHLKYEMKNHFHTWNGNPIIPVFNPFLI
jgi:hypothetical protein